MVQSKKDDDIPTAAAAAVDAEADPPLAVLVVADAPLANTIEYDEIPKLLFVDMQQEDEEKVEVAVKKLADLVVQSNANQKVNVDLALSCGAIAVILLLMRKWHYSRSVQFPSCCVLSRLTHSNDSAASMIKSGGIETIMAAMKSFPDYDGIQVYGCKTIQKAFGYYVKRLEPVMALSKRGPVYQERTIDDPIMDEAMTRFVHQLNGIQLVVSVMKKFPNTESVQLMGCHVLQELSRLQVLRDALKKGGALSAVGEAAEKHNGNSIQPVAAAFFKNMFG